MPPSENQSFWVEAQVLKLPHCVFCLLLTQGTELTCSQMLTHCDPYTPQEVGGSVTHFTDEESEVQNGELTAQKLSELVLGGGDGGDQVRPGQGTPESQNLLQLLSRSPPGSLRMPGWVKQRKPTYFCTLPCTKHAGRICAKG